MPHSISRWGLNLIREAGLWLSDVTTGDVSTAKHGFAPKLPNDATKYLDGTGAYSVPAGTGGGGGTAWTVTASKTANYTAAASDFVRCNATSGAFTVTLPAAASNTNAVIHVKKTDSSANYVTVDGNSTETIDGDLTVLLTTKDQVLSLISDGTNWLRF